VVIAWIVLLVLFVLFAGLLWNLRSRRLKGTR
jgi:hypothetical protein